MCGISGYYHVGRTSPETIHLNKLKNLLRHRGPDNFGTYYDDTVGLIHHRLSLLDLSPNGNQPFENERCVFIYNGEVYNYQHLRQKYLATKDIRFVSGSDTEVLYHLLQHYPISEIINEFEGMFAFAYYDKLEKKLYLGRDKLGIKPLFYLKAPDGNIYFSSEMKSFLDLAPLEISDFRTFFATQGVYDSAAENTPFKNVLHVRPGHYLEIRNGNIQEYCYFRLADMIDPAYYKQQDRKSEADILREFEDTLSQNIQAMLMSDAPMGAFVSGGIDSSLVSAIATKYKKIDLFTADVKGKHSEVEDARSLARHLDLKLHEYAFKEEYLVRDFVKCTWHMEIPIVTHVNAVPFSGVAGLAHSMGVKAVLTGEGSDELFLGYPRLLTKRYDNLIKAPAHAVDWLYKKIPGLSKYVLNVNESNMSETLINIAKQNQRQRQKEDIARLGHIPESERWDQYLSMRMMQEHLVSLLWRNDRMGMIASIESRFPFLGDSMMRFAFNLPLKYKIGRISRFYNYKHPFLIDKCIVRKASQPYLPEQLVYKKKNGFPLKGVAHFRPDAAFFKGGILQSSAGLRDRDLEYFLSTTDKYILGKFVSLETFHKLFIQRMDTTTVENVFRKHVKLV